MIVVIFHFAFCLLISYFVYCLSVLFLFILPFVCFLHFNALIVCCLFTCCFVYCLCAFCLSYVLFVCCLFSGLLDFCFCICIYFLCCISGTHVGDTHVRWYCWCSCCVLGLVLRQPWSLMLLLLVICYLCSYCLLFVLVFTLFHTDVRPWSHMSVSTVCSCLLALSLFVTTLVWLVLFVPCSPWSCIRLRVRSRAYMNEWVCYVCVCVWLSVCHVSLHVCRYVCVMNVWARLRASLCVCHVSECEYVCK